MKDRIGSSNHEFINPIEDKQDAIMNKEDLRTGSGWTIHTEEDQGMDKITEVGQDMILIIEVITDMRCDQRNGRPSNNNSRENFSNQNYDRNRSRSFQRQNRERRDDRSVSNSRSISGLRTTTDRDRIICFECGEYEHLARDCSMMQASKEAKQIQQMFNMDVDQIILQTPLMDVEQDGQTVGPAESRDNLNL